VRIIAKKRLREFWLARKGDAGIAERDLLAWHEVARDAEWKDFGSLKQSFGSADRVGNCIVFDVGNNRFRLIGRVFFGSGKLYVLKIMDHHEYDKRQWIEECRCHMPQPRLADPDAAEPPRKQPRKGKKA
jgi:mRNA interferase HigB